MSSPSLQLGDRAVSLRGVGYKVATSLIGPYTGLVSGAALMVDYILTMAISVARNGDGAFSPLPLPVAAWSFKLWIALGLASGIDHLSIADVATLTSVCLGQFFG